jgi:RHS repeat-associated protein
VTVTRRYDAWGNVEIGATEPGFAFTGREWDPVPGLHYYRARYYDSALARFISVDPLGHRADPNEYSYVRSRPVNLVDPTGLFSERMMRFKYPVPLCVATGQGPGMALFVYAYHAADDDGYFPNEPNWTRDRERHCFAACVAKRFFPCDPLAGPLPSYSSRLRHRESRRHRKRGGRHQRSQLGWGKRSVTVGQDV